MPKKRGHMRNGKIYETCLFASEKIKASGATKKHPMKFVLIGYKDEKRNKELAKQIRKTLNSLGVKGLYKLEIYVPPTVEPKLIFDEFVSEDFVTADGWRGRYRSGVGFNKWEAKEYDNNVVLKGE